MDLPALWFCLVSLMLALYVVFDGFDLGAGILHLFAKPDDQARIRESLGPYWHGNVVWLLAAALIATHNLELAKYMDRVMALDHGHLVQRS